MCRGSEHGARPACLRLRAGTVEIIYRQAEVSRIAAHFVQRNKAIETIKSRVFDTLGHHRPGQLLQTHDPLSLELAAFAQDKNVAKKIEQLSVQLRPAYLGIIDGAVDDSRILIAYDSGFSADVSSVNRERRD